MKEFEAMKEKYSNTKNIDIVQNKNTINNNTCENFFNINGNKTQAKECLNPIITKTIRNEFNDAQEKVIFENNKDLINELEKNNPANDIKKPNQNNINNSINSNLKGKGFVDNQIDKNGKVVYDYSKHKELLKNVYNNAVVPIFNQFNNIEQLTVEKKNYLNSHGITKPSNNTIQLKGNNLDYFHNNFIGADTNLNKEGFLNSNQKFVLNENLFKKPTYKHSNKKDLSVNKDINNNLTMLQGLYLGGDQNNNIYNNNLNSLKTTLPKLNNNFSTNHGGFLQGKNHSTFKKSSLPISTRQRSIKKQYTSEFEIY